jgi:hypothetical protein
MDDVNLMACFFGLTVFLNLVFAVGVFIAARNLRAKGESVPSMELPISEISTDTVLAYSRPVR